MDSGHAAGVHNCPHSGCIRVFQSLSTLERHLFLENCAYRLYRSVLQTLLGVRIGLLLKVTIGHQEALVVLKEGWTLKAVIDKQQS